MAKIDCSITENYLKEKARMTKSSYSDSCTINCRDCPLSSDNNIHGYTCNCFEKMHPKEAISVIQKWSDEHQREIDWMKVPMNTPVYVRDSEGRNWISRRIMCYLPNKSDFKFVCFMNSEIHENASNIECWKYCKLADEVDPTPYYKEEA